MATGSFAGHEKARISEEGRIYELDLGHMACKGWCSVFDVRDHVLGVTGGQTSFRWWF